MYESLGTHKWILDVFVLRLQQFMINSRNLTEIIFHHLHDLCFIWKQSKCILLQQIPEVLLYGYFYRLRQCFAYKQSGVNILGHI